jgi:hypothetical protein
MDSGSSELKLVESTWTLSLALNQAIISITDADLSVCGVMALPDQPGPSPHVRAAPSLPIL